MLSKCYHSTEVNQINVEHAQQWAVTKWASLKRNWHKYPTRQLAAIQSSRDTKQTYNHF